ncbi:hypothetical protein NW752_010257 [Fusarium irregulare]|uniref:Uncharacterized protein n=1 Tax=Fusarium irregulare TaxID=2494466 RepID=A0A9W8PIJ7_9HYPO|nr:hypothetical protein NW752_010257 [Fusarium irregulare]KAJ4007894.1 hypothetical protein NW766_009706 [Fusarium irregulare]
MRFSLLAAVMLATSSIAAPTENSLAVRESHLVDAEGKLNALAFDADGFVIDPEAQKATTNVKRSKEEPLAKTSVIKHKSRKGKKKPYKQHPKRLISLKISSTGFKNGGEIVKSLDSAFDQIAPHTDNTDGILAQVQAGKLSQAKGMTQTLKEVSAMRTILSGPLSQLSATRNLKSLDLTSAQRNLLIQNLDDLLTEIIRTVDNILRSLDPNPGLNASLHPLMNVLTSLLQTLATADNESLAPEIRDLVGLVLKEQAADNGGSGLTMLLSGVENGLLSFYGKLKTLDI